MDAPKTLQQAIQYFSNYENCKEFMVAIRWPDGRVQCPHCGSYGVTYLEKAKVWKCYAKHERPKFSLKTGTVFEDSPLGLDKWLPVMWMLVNAKNGISSWEIHRAMGVTQKTAWFMLQRCRLALQDENQGGKLGGEVEVDETFIGGRARNVQLSKRSEKVVGRGSANKEIVLGMIERQGTVRTVHVQGRGKPELQKHIREHVEAGSAIFTDELDAYGGLSPEFQHEVINHAVQYVNGNVHTNTMENFWALLKRSLKGTYVSVEPFHLFRYLDEQAFRFNNRKFMNDGQRFTYAMRKIVGKRITYNELTGKTGEEETRPKVF